MISVPRIYCDANPIIELAKYSKKTHDPNRERDLWMLQRLLKAAQNDEVALFTSTISVAECVAAGDDWDQQVQEFFVGTLTSGRMFRLVQDTIFVAERARDLRWKDNIRLKGMDAIHVASALDARCTEFLTWDLDMGKSKVAAKATALAALGLRVTTPADTKLLPDFYTTETKSLFLNCLEDTHHEGSLRTCRLRSFNLTAGDPAYTPQGSRSRVATEARPSTAPSPTLTPGPTDARAHTQL